MLFPPVITGLVSWAARLSRVKLALRWHLNGLSDVIPSLTLTRMNTDAAVLAGDVLCHVPEAICRITGEHH
jgi:hypothetical protein